MPLKRVKLFLFMPALIIFIMPFTAASSRVLSEDAVRIIHLSSSGYEHGLSVVFSPDGNQIAVGVSSGISLYNSQTLSRERFIGTNSWARSVTYSPDGQSVYAGLFDGTAQLWRASDGRLLQVFENHTGWVRSIALSRDGKTLITAADDDSVNIWSISDSSLKLTVNRLTGVRVLALSPDDQILAVGLQDSSIQLLRVSDGSVIRTLIGHKDWVRSLAFSPDGNKLASGAFDATARLWDIASGQLDYVLSGHRSSVLGLTFSPDGGTLATGSVDTTVKLWDMRDGGLLRTLVGHNDFVYGVAFSPDGKVLASVSSDNTARLWDVTIPEPSPVSQSPTSSDCRDCHHPRGIGAPPRVIQVSCEVCHANGIGLNWCAFFPRSAEAVSEIFYSPPSDPVGVPIATDTIAVQINYPTNGETLYVSGHNLSPVFVVGRVFYRGDQSDINIRMEIWSGGQLSGELFTQPDQDGAFTFKLVTNPDGDPVVAGAKAADPDCASCHEEFKGEASFPDGQVHFVVTAVTPNGDQVLDERWITVDTSSALKVDVRAVDKESGASISGLSVRAAAILYEWRDRYANEISDNNGIASLSLESLSQSVTRYEITVPPTSLNGYFYESVEPVTLDLQPGASIHEPVTIYVDVMTGQITGTLTGVELSDPLDIWAVHLPDGAYHKTSMSNEAFIFNDLPSGEYRVFVDPAVHQFGYRAEPIQVDLTKEAQAAINIELKKTATASISGRVYDENGNYLPFGWITPAAERTSQLDPFEGTYQFFGLNQKKTTVIADAPGYYSQAQVIDMVNGQTEILDFSLALRPETILLPWGNGNITLPPETDYEESNGTIALKRGWIWGTNDKEQDLALRVAGMQIELTSGSFALEYLPLQGGWLYLMEGNAVIRTADAHEIPVSSGQMVALSDQFTPVPVPYDETVVSALHPSSESLLQNYWEPALASQIRDRLAQVGISIVQVITFVTYMLVLIVIVTLLIGGIYSTWKYIKKRSS